MNIVYPVILSHSKLDVKAGLAWQYEVFFFLILYVLYFSGETKTCMYNSSFQSFLHTDMTQIVEILSSIRQGPT